MSEAHLNKMFDGNSNPIPLKGFTKLGFLDKEFSKVTDKLEYYLKPTPELLEDPNYLNINTNIYFNYSYKCFACCYGIRSKSKTYRLSFN